MEFFKWKNSFNTGIDVIDQQHRSFLEMVNECYEIATHFKQATVDEKLVFRLKLYAMNHFKFEEEMFSSCGYNESEHHMEQHELFSERIAEMVNAQRAGRDEEVTVLLAFVRDWFLKHILECDMKYVPYLQQSLAGQQHKHA